MNIPTAWLSVPAVSGERDCPAYATGKIIGADAARACACLGVVAAHLRGVVAAASWPAPLEQLVQFGDYGKFGVAIFFVLSGFLLGLPFWRSIDTRGELPSLRTYFLRRAARIIPAAWLCLITSFVLGSWFLDHPPMGHAAIRLLAGMLFVSDWHWLTLYPVDVNGPLWSLSFEVSSYVMMAIAFAALHRLLGAALAGWRGRAAWMIVIVFALLTHGLFSIVFAHDVAPNGIDQEFEGAWEWFPQYNPFGFFAIFAVGTLASGLKSLVSKRTSAKSHANVFGALIGAFAVTLLTLQLLSALGVMSPPFAFPTLPFATSAALLLASTFPLQRLLDNRFVSLIAAISFGIYVWHVPVITVMNRVVPLDVEAHGRALTVSLSALAGTLMIAYVSYRWFELPIINWARHLELSRELGASSKHAPNGKGRTSSDHLRECSGS